MSVVFKWDWVHFSELLQTCDYDCERPYILKYMSRSGKNLEAGCGSGRYVKYLSDRGFDIAGIEIFQETVNTVKSVFPNLDIRQGNVLNLPFEDNEISGIISLGVLEHFIEGPSSPLKEMYRVLKQGGYAVITVTSYNYLRRIKYLSGIGMMNEIGCLNPKRINFVRKIFRKEPIKKWHRRANLPYGNKALASKSTFFQYFFTKQEFENEVRKSGFKIVESVPVQLLHGIHHEVWKGLINYDEVKCNPNIFGKIINKIFSQIPFFHNSMHLCVVKK